MSTATSTATICRHCQLENSSPRRFCGGCGKSLWEKCPACFAEIAGNVRFCGTCGTDVQGKRQEIADALQGKLEQARALAAAHRYPQALELLESLASCSEDGREVAAAAGEEIPRVQGREQRQKDLAVIALRQGEELLAGRAYDAARQVLESIPEPLRTREINESLERAQSQGKEVLALNGEIRMLLEARRTSELFPKIERLLALQPEHAQAQKLAVQLRDQILAVAVKRLNEHLYADALELLERIPAFARNGDVESALDKATELSVLFAELRTAPLALPSTLAVVQKLLKTAPKNPEVARLTAEFQARCAAKPEHARMAAAAWAKAPQRTRLGMPVEWLGHFTRLTCEAAGGAKTLRESPGQFLVALGLALQGIEAADTAVNLLPPEKTGLLGKLPFSFGKKPLTAAWGFDLGESGLRAIKLSKETKSGALKLESCQHIPHAQPLAPMERSLERNETAVATLKEFLRWEKTEGIRIVASLSSQRVLGRFFNLPPMAGKKVAEAVQFEAKHQIPVPLEELCWAYDVQGPATAGGKDQDDRSRKILLAATRVADAQAQASLFKTAGISLDELVPDSLALHNAFQFEFHAEQTGPVALLDLGLEGASFVVSAPRSVWFRSFGLGGENFTQALARVFQLTREQAEDLKLKPAKARRYSLYCATQEPLFVQLASEIERSLSSYSRFHLGEPAERLYGLGGAFQTHGLFRYLRSGK
jgi:type IV pilus assembly protein PilM